VSPELLRGAHRRGEPKIGLTSTSPSVPGVIDASARAWPRSRALSTYVPAMAPFVSANGPLSVTAPVTRPAQSRQVRVFWPPYDLTA
jgi:hypothetical protein